MDTLKSMKVFCSVVETGSFVKASELLNISTAMASKHVAHLEKELKTRLLHRTSRHVSLSAMGARYYPQCKEALERLDYAANLTQEDEIQPEGVLKISAPVWFASEFFAEITHQFHKKYPKIKLEVDLNNRLVDLAEEGYDLALRVVEEPKATDIAIAIAKVDFVLVCKPDLNALIKRGEVDVTQIETVIPNYINLSKARMVSQQKTIPFMDNAIFKSDSTIMNYQWVKQGDRLAYLPFWLIKQDIERGNLAVVPDFSNGKNNYLYAIYPHRRYISIKARRFIEFIKEVVCKQ